VRHLAHRLLGFVVPRSTMASLPLLSMCSMSPSVSSMLQPVIDAKLALLPQFSSGQGDRGRSCLQDFHPPAFHLQSSLGEELDRFRVGFAFLNRDALG